MQIQSETLVLKDHPMMDLTRQTGTGINVFPGTKQFRLSTSSPR